MKTKIKLYSMICTGESSLYSVEVFIRARNKKMAAKKALSKIKHLPYPYIEDKHAKNIRVARIVPHLDTLFIL